MKKIEKNQKCSSYMNGKKPNLSCIRQKEGDLRERKEG